jgi:hypothetical protein
MCTFSRVNNKYIQQHIKAIPLQALTGTEGCRRLRLPDFIQQTNAGGKVVSHKLQPPLPPRNYFWHSFLFGHAVAQWLWHCATNREVAGSIPDGVIRIFH